MPNIKDAKSTIDPSRLVPDYNFGGREIEPLGSMDTSLTRFLGGSYDRGFNPYDNQQDSRFNNENWKMWLANNLGALAGKTANGVIQGVGAATSLIASPLALRDDVTFEQMFSDNPINRFASGVDKTIESSFPRIQSSEFNSLSFWDQIKPGNWGQMISQNTDSFAFLASSFASAGLLSKLNVGEALVGKLAKQKPIFNYLSKISGPNKAGLSDKINFFLSNEILSVNESAMEATDTSKALRDTLRLKRNLGENNLTDEQIEEKANKAATNSFWLNMITSSITNSTLTGLMSPMWEKAANKANPYALKFLDGKFQAPAYSTKFTKFLKDKGYAPGVLAKEIVGNAISEGLEESLQYSIQKINSDDGLSFKDSASKYLTDIVSLEILNMGDPDRLKAAGLGGLIGAGSPIVAAGLGIRKGSNLGAFNEAAKFSKEKAESLKNLNDNYASLSGLGRFKDQEVKMYVSNDKYMVESGKDLQAVSKEEFENMAAENGVDPVKGGTFTKPGELAYDDDGNPMLSSKAIDKLVSDLTKYGEMDDLIAKEANSSKPNETRLRLYKGERLAAAAQTAYEAGVMDIFQDQLNTLENDSIVSLNPSIPAKEEIALAKDFVERLNSAYTTIGNSLLDEQQKKVAMKKAGRIVTLDYAGQVEQTKLDNLATSFTPEQLALGEALASQYSILDAADRTYAAKMFDEEAKKTFNKAISELDIDQIKQADSATKEYARSKANLQHIIDSREEIGKTLDTILAGGKEDATSVFDKDSLPFQNPSSLKEYEYFESRMQRKLKYDNNVDKIMDDYNSGMMAELEKYLSVQDPLSAASELSDFVSQTVKGQVSLPDDAINSLLDKIESVKKATDDLQAAVSSQAESIDYNPEFYPPQTPEEEMVADEYDNLTALKKAVEPLLSVNKDSFSKRKQRSASPKSIFESLIQPAKDLLSKAYKDDKLDATFADESSIQVELSKLRNLESVVVSNRDDLKGFDLPTIIKQLEKLDKDYQEVKKDREIKNAKQDTMYASFVVDVATMPELWTDISAEDQAIFESLEDDKVSAALFAADRVTNKEALLKLKDQVNGNFTSFLRDEIGIKEPEDLVGMMYHNPLRGFGGIIDRVNFIAANEGLAIDAFKKFKVDYDLVDLMSAPLDDKMTKLRKFFATYYGLWELDITMNSNLSTKDILESYLGYLKSNVKITPTSAQYRTASQMARFASSPKQTVGGRVQAYQNIALFKSPAGAGKTSVVLPLASKLLKLDASELYTAAPFDPGAKAIANSTNTQAKNVSNLIEDLRTNNIPSDTRVFVVDEVSTLSYEILHELAGAFAKFQNENQDRHVKMIMMYDPLQTNYGANGRPVIENVSFSKGAGYDFATPDVKKQMEAGLTLPSGTLPFIHNAVDLSPLSTTFRSNVQSIIDLQNLFKGDDRVTNTPTSASVNPNTSTKDILGTYSGGNKEILQVLSSSYKTNPGRSRAIVTDNPQYWQDALIANGMNDVAVLTVATSSGVTVEEAYVDIKVESSPNYNRNLYTALSRASKFLYLGNYKTDFVEDTSIPEKVKKAELLNESRNSSTIEYVQAQINLFSDSIVQSTPRQDVEETITEQVIEEDQPMLELDQEPFVLAVPPVPTSMESGAHILNFPSNTVFEDTEDAPALKAGDKVILVKDDSLGKTRYVVLQRLSDGGYRTAAILSDGEIATFESTVLGGKSLSSLKPETLVNDFRGGKVNQYLKEISGNPISSFIELEVSEGSEKLQFHYGNTPTTLNYNNVDSVISKLITDLYKDWKGIRNASEIQANPAEFSSVKVFFKEEEARQALQLTNVDGLLNIPLLIVDGIELENGGRVKPLFIRLNTAILDSTNHKVLSPIREFVAKLKRFEELIPQQTWPSQVYYHFKNGYSIVQDTSNVYFPFHKFVRQIAKGKVAVVASKELNDKLPSEQKMLDIDTSTLSPEFVQLAKEIDELVHGNKAYKGAAQRAFDSLAATNFIAELPSGKSLILRDSRVVPEFTANKLSGIKDELSAISLLGPVLFEHDKGKSKNPLVSDRVIEKSKAYLASYYERTTGAKIPASEIPLAIKDSVAAPRYKFLADLIINSKTAHIPPVSTDDLYELINGFDSNGKFTNINRGFGLRSPADVKKDGEVKSGIENFETTFRMATPTQIGVSLVKSTIPSNVPEADAPKQVSPYEEFFKMIDDAKSLEDALSHADEFSHLTFAKPINEIISDRYEAVHQAGYYKTVTTKIKDLLLSTRADKPSLRSRLLEALNASPTATSYGQYAARDFIRASVYAEIMPEVYNTNPNRILDVVRANVNLLYDAVSSFVNPFIENAKLVQETYASIFEEAGIEYTHENTTINIVESIVRSSSAYRHKMKEENFKLQDTSTKTVNEFSQYLTLLSKAALAGSAQLSEFVRQPSEHLERLKGMIEIVDLTDRDEVYLAAINAKESADVERSMRITDNSDLGDMLDEDGAVKLYKSFFNTRSLKTLFSKKGTEAFHIITKAYMEYQLGKKNWGLFKNGVVYAVKDAENKVGSKIIRHEAFHKVFWNYLTKEEQYLAIQLGRSKHGENLSILDIEERLADDFANYVSTNNVWASIKSIFNKILRFFNFSYNNLTSLESFFESINSGYYSQVNPHHVLIERDLKIAKFWPNVDLFIKAKSIFLDAFTELSEQSRQEGGPFRTFESSIEDTHNLIKSYYYDGIPNSVEGDPEFIKEAIAPLATNAKAYRDFIDEYFANANAKRAKAQKLNELRENKTKLSERLAELQEQLKSIDDSSDEYAPISEEIDDIEDEIKANIAEETFEAELRDPADKLTGMVKARLIGLRYLDNKKVVYAPLSKSYASIISLVNQADTSSVDNLLASLSERIKYFFDGKSTAGVQPTIRKASAIYLGNLIERIRNTKAPSNLSFFKDVSSPNEYAIFDKKGESTANITYTMAALDDRYTKVERLSKDSATTFAANIMQATGLSLEDVRKAYNLFEDVNFIRSLTASAVSLRKFKPFVGSSRWDFYNWINRYSQVGTSGQKAAIESVFVDRFVTRVSKTGTPFTPDLIDVIEGAVDTTQKRLAFQSLFQKLGMPSISKELPDLQINQAFDRLKNSYKEINKELTKYDPFSVIDDQGTLVSTIVELFENSASMVEVGSYIRGDGKKAYGYIDASLQSAILNFIDKSNSSRPQSTFKPNHLYFEGKSLKSDSPFLKNNPFINGKGHIRSMVDHDSMKKVGANANATYLYSESLEDYHKRNVQFGFMNRLKSSGSGYYYQFLPVPANRRSMQAAEVRAYSISKAKNILLDLIEAERNRPDLPELSNNKVYQKNKDSFTLPGLSGSTKTNLTNAEYLKQIEDHIESQLITLVKEWMGGEGKKGLDIDPSDLSYVLNYKEFSNNTSGYVPYTDLLSEAGRLREAGDTERADVKIREADKMRERALTEIARVFYYNSIVNQYALSQMLYGDNAFYKHKEDLTKRIQVFTATGDTLLIDDKYGLPKKSYVAVLADVNLPIPKDLDGVRADSYRDSYMETDAEGYMLPEFYELIARTYGIESSVDTVLKPVYAGMDKNAIPLAIKYSSKVLTDDFVKDFPHLKELRKSMRDRGVQQVVFESAVKVSAPSKIARFTDEGRVRFGDSDGFGDSVLEIDNRFLRFQLNPAKNIETTVANPSQGTAFMNTNGLNADEIEDLFELNSKVISLGDMAVSRELFLSEKGTMTNSSVKALDKRIVSSTDGIPNGQDVNYLKSYESPTGEKISNNLPIIQQKVLATIASIFTNMSTGFRFAGSKMVLQSEFGTYSAHKERLKYKDSEGYTEVLLPRAYEKFFSVGDKLGSGKNTMVAFRIPSTNYHSMLALKVKGFYDAPVNSESNVIIAPSMIVYYHGSDYDVDTLFIIKKKEADANINLNDILMRNNVATDYSEALIIKQGEYYGFKDGKQDIIEGLPFHDYLIDKLSQFEKEIKYVRSRREYTPDMIKRVELNQKLKTMEEDYYKLIDIAQEAAKNSIVDLFSRNIADRKNRTDLLTPISFARVAGLKSVNIDEFYKDIAEDETLLKDLVEAGIITIQC